MALTKCFVILFLAYLNLDISPLYSAAIPERLDSPDSINENDENPENSEVYTTTWATDEDIGKIFETYENLYVKNWFNDDELTKNANNENLLETHTEEQSTSRDLETTEPTADDVVESIHNIMDEKIDAKKNRTDRTIVVVVTTNVFHVHGSDESNKRQHTLLSFGTPEMIEKETSTDTTLAMHNKITTEFFNSNPPPTAEQSGTLQTNSNQKCIIEGSGTIEPEDSDGNTENILQVTEGGQSPDVSATEQPRSDGGIDGDQEFEIDVRRLDDAGDIQSANTVSEGRSFDDDLTNYDSNDVLKIMKIIPNRSMDVPSSLSKPFELPVQEPQDSSLMEAIENILDTDVRKAFERDIPQTRHVPFDINIEEEALYAPLKDLSEYIVEDVPVSGNYDIFPDNLKTVAEEVDSPGKIGKSLDMKDGDYFTESDNLTHKAATEIYQKLTATTTTDQPTIASSITEETTTTLTTITVEEQTKALDTEAPPIFKETISTTTAREDEKTTKTTDEPESEDKNENEDSISTTKLEARISDNQIEKSRVENPERGETLQRSNLPELPVPTEHDELSNRDNYESTESILENQSEVQDKLPQTLLISNPVDEPAPFTDNTNEAPDEKWNEENPERKETLRENQSELRHKLPETLPVFNPDVEPSSTAVDHTTDDASNPLIGTFEKLVDNSFDEYPTYVHLDTTTEYVTNPNLYIGAMFSGEQVAAIMEEAERAKTSSTVQLLSSTPEDDEFSVEEDTVNAEPNSFDIDKVPSKGDVTTLFDLEEKLNEVNHKLDVVIKDAEMEKMNVDKINFIEVLALTTTKPNGEDVISEVAKVDEETTEQHQIIKKPGVDDTINGTIDELKTIRVANESNHLLTSKKAIFEGRSFSDNDDDPVDPLRTLVEAVELTADITKSVDNFQSFNEANDSIPFAANQIIENKDDMALVKNYGELNIADASSVWCVYVYIACGALSIALIVFLGIVSYLRFRQFKRNILFSC